MIEVRLVSIVDGIVMLFVCFLTFQKTSLGLVRGVTDFFFIFLIFVFSLGVSRGVTDFAANAQSSFDAHITESTRKVSKYDRYERAACITEVTNFAIYV